MSRVKKGPLRTKGGRGGSGISRDPQEVFVSIYCRGTVDAPHEKWRITSFTPDVHEGEVFWTESVNGYAEIGNTTFFRIFPPATQWLDGNEYRPRTADGAALVDGQRDAEVFYRDSFRVGWMLKCPTCPFARKVGNPRDAYTLLLALAKKGIMEVGVREFTRRVGVVP